MISVHKIFFALSAPAHIFFFEQIASTGLLHDKALILISTISGSLVAVEQKTGDIRWKLANGSELYYLLSAYLLS
jgi:outer membrane protein assembly factor BamB